MKVTARRRCMKTASMLAVWLCLLLIFVMLGYAAIAASNRPLAPGDQGEDVRILQAQLMRRGLLPHAPDGVYGELTRRAVASYQALRGLPADGLAGEQTLQALYAADLLEKKGAGQHAGDTQSQLSIANNGAGETDDLALPNQLPTPSGPGDAGPHVLQLQRMLHQLGYLRGEEAAAFDGQTLQAVAAFQKDHGLRVDGRADRQTLFVLLDALAAPADDAPPPTRMPSWYGGGSELIPWGAIFRVQDVATGLTFTALRMEGFSHIDAEPLTPYDTQVINQLYGGEWSWDRRAILLRYGDNVIAASMNGMPHGFSSNPASGMGGHFCIHLYESRGHGSQRISDTHIAAVLEASRSTWRGE